MDAERAQLGLDKPLWRQFVDWMWGIARFDFGDSMWTGRPITYEIAIRLQLSLQLAVMATVVAVLLSIPLGTVAALRQDTWVDYVVRVFSIAGLAMPSFWLGILMILSMLIFFRWLPPMFFTPIWVDPWANLSQLIWPALAVGYRYSAVATRMTRSAVLEVLREDYIRTARAKGLSRRRVVLKHAMRNALVPVITVAGMQFGALLAGAVVTEKVFARPGLGTLLLEAIAQRDYRVVQGCALTIAVLYVVVNLITDLLYAATDPRIRL
jgi:peptide/nickel transport system permease protein